MTHTTPTKMESIETTLALIRKDIGYVKKSMDDINGRLDVEFAKKSEVAVLTVRLNSLSKLVYGSLATVGIGIIGIVLTRIFG